VLYNIIFIVLGYFPFSIIPTLDQSAFQLTATKKDGHSWTWCSCQAASRIIRPCYHSWIEDRPTLSWKVGRRHVQITGSLSDWLTSLHPFSGRQSEYFFEGYHSYRSRWTRLTAGSSIHPRQYGPFLHRPGHAAECTDVSEPPLDYNESGADKKAESGLNEWVPMRWGVGVSVQHVDVLQLCEVCRSFSLTLDFYSPIPHFHSIFWPL